MCGCACLGGRPAPHRRSLPAAFLTLTLPLPCRATAPRQAAKFLTAGAFDYQWLVDESMDNLPLGGCNGRG